MVSQVRQFRHVYFLCLMWIAVELQKMFCIDNVVVIEMHTIEELYSFVM